MKILFPRLQTDSGIFSVVDCPVVVRAAALDVPVPLEVYVGIDDRCRENGTWTPLVVDGNPVTIGGGNSHVVLSLPGKYRLGAVGEYDDYTYVTVGAVCDRHSVTNEFLWNLSRAFAGGTGNPGCGVSEAQVTELIQAALAGLAEPGLSEAQVIELIQAALAELPPYPAPFLVSPPYVNLDSPEVGLATLFEGLWHNTTEVNAVLVQDGIDVTDQIQGNTWTPTAAGHFTYTVTATGPGGSVQADPVEGTVVGSAEHPYRPARVGLVNYVPPELTWDGPADDGGMVSYTAPKLVWDAPANGGAPINMYHVQVVPAGESFEGAESSIVFTTTAIVEGLAFGDWSARVRAVNSRGDGAWSETYTFTVDSRSFDPMKYDFAWRRGDKGVMLTRVYAGQGVSPTGFRVLSFAPRGKAGLTFAEANTSSNKVVYRRGDNAIVGGTPSEAGRYLTLAPGKGWDKPVTGGVIVVAVVEESSNITQNSRYAVDGPKVIFNADGNAVRYTFSDDTGLGTVDLPDTLQPGTRYAWYAELDYDKGTYAVRNPVTGKLVSGALGAGTPTNSTSIDLLKGFVGGSLHGFAAVTWAAGETRPLTMEVVLEDFLPVLGL